MHRPCRAWALACAILLSSAAWGSNARGEVLPTMGLPLFWSEYACPADAEPALSCPFEQQWAASIEIGRLPRQFTGQSIDEHNEFATKPAYDFRTTYDPVYDEAVYGSTRRHGIGSSLADRLMGYQFDVSSLLARARSAVRLGGSANCVGVLIATSRWLARYEVVDGDAVWHSDDAPREVEILAPAQLQSPSHDTRQRPAVSHGDPARPTMDFDECPWQHYGCWQEGSPASSVAATSPISATAARCLADAIAPRDLLRAAALSLRQTGYALHELSEVLLRLSDAGDASAPQHAASARIDR